MNLELPNFNVYGNPGSTGLGNAYGVHKEAIASLTDISDCRFGDGVFYENSYVHGLPKQTKEIVGLGSNGNVAYWVWESSELSDDFRKYQHHFDKILTCSSYCQEVLQEGLDREVMVVPHAVTKFRYQPEVLGTFTFLCMFDGGSRVLRKNVAFVLDTWQEAFGDSKEVKLIIKCKNVSRYYLQWLKSLVGDCNVQIIDREYDDRDMEVMWGIVDGVYSPHKSEGFGLVLLEGMARGKVVVASEYGGCKDFLTNDNSFLIHCDEEKVSDEYYRGMWGSPYRDEAVKGLQASIEDTEKKRKKAFQRALDFDFGSLLKRTEEVLSE